MAQMTITQFMTGIKNWVLGKIENITALIPSQASSSNQLADKDFVNSSIATATATFRGTYNVVSDLSLSYNATHAQIQAALVTKMSALSITPDNNDYAFVQIPTADATPTQIAKIEKYKYNGTAWAFEYELNNSGFTASQWAAINSGATLELIGKLQALPTNAELTTLLGGKVDKANGKGLSANDYTDGEKEKLAGLENYNDTQIRQLINEEKTARQQGDNALSESVTQEETRARGVEQTLQLAIDTINGKIPAQATSQNQLADKEYVNDKVSTATADFKGTYNSLEDLEQVTANANDYAFVIAADTAGNTLYKRYKWVEGTGWVWEYDLNNSSFTAAQWAAIQSGITSALVTKLSELPDNSTLNQRITQAIASALTAYYTKSEIDTALGNKQDVIQDLATIRSGASAGATALQPSALTPYSTTEQMNAAIKTESDRAKEAEEANAEEIDKLKAVIADIETVAEGYVRVAGSSSPVLSYKSYKYHEQGGFGRESVFHLFYPCLVGTKLSGTDAQVGKIKYVLKKFGAQTIDGVAMWEDLDGNFHAIGGTEGDVMICNIEPYFRIKGKHTIEGTEYDVYLVSRLPFTWQGIDAEEVAKNGWSPDYCVSHTDTDDVVRMHSVYNPAWNGTYSAPAGVAGKYVYTIDQETGDIVETYDADTTLLGGAGGLHSTDITLPTGEQQAMNMNPDTTSPVPFYNHTAAGAENMHVLMLAEGGTFDAHNASRMGSGFSSNDAATSAGDWEQSGSGAKNGLRVMDKDGAWKNYSLGGNVRFLLGETSGTRYAANVINYWRNPWHIMEAHRAVSYAVQNDIHELEWFVFEGNKYKYRSVQGFNTPAQGEMTCVVWKLMATQAGSAAIDPTDLATSIAGNRVEILVSTALFHGMTTQVSPSWWTSGLIFTEDENGVYDAYMERDQSQLIKSETGDKDIAEQFNFEQHYKHVGRYTKGDGYRKNYTNDALMLPDTNANKSGGGLHTYVGAYNYFSGSNAPAGKKSVRGFRRGYSAYYTFLSPLCVYASFSPSPSLAACAFGTCCQIVE